MTSAAVLRPWRTSDAPVLLEASGDPVLARQFDVETHARLATDPGPDVRPLTIVRPAP
ncbi:hypothetical protein GCM10017714_07960 [Curtobacterium pusillum]|uniref:N-acetyltransferase n=1 Tax=Curtobacterium pusillum TaxID=69373 RepID=A0ABX2MBY4_9MICO|nr:hypothetical protein [Curtobacterium pusillum]NUU12846.1 hypothetical protein [Curtobacterium pusillum]GLK30059.1 hypothetical protein GCM10017610_03440 [Curtobacterium pusillum]